MRPRQISFALRASDRSAVRRTRGRLNIGKNAANRLLGVAKGCEPLRVCENQWAVRGGTPRDVGAFGINPRDPPAFPADRDGSEAYCNHDRRSPVRSARREHPERPQPGDDGFGRGIGAVSHHTYRPSANVAPPGKKWPVGGRVPGPRKMALRLGAQRAHRMDQRRVARTVGSHLLE
jgi:hypothetical protein